MELTLTEYQDELISKWVRNVEYTKMGEKTTVCLLTTVRGFEIVGTSACVDPKQFNQEIGQHFALVNALDKLDEVVGFYRQMTEV